ncbi:MAG: 4Fe-4S binding protein [Candidatus Cloacimonetes bacterium]|nr:4Fe-4S binding protein [Candidatus Cloacimonadota bacterium]
MIIDHDLCDICGTCVAVCAADAIRVSEFLVTIDDALCTKCGACLRVCPIKAIREGKDV